MMLRAQGHMQSFAHCRQLKLQPCSRVSIVHCSRPIQALHPPARPYVAAHAADFDQGPPQEDDVLQDEGNFPLEGLSLEGDDDLADEFEDSGLLFEEEDLPGIDQDAGLVDAAGIVAQHRRSIGSQLAQEGLASLMGLNQQLADDGDEGAAELADDALEDGDPPAAAIESDSQYPDPPARPYLVADLFGKAAYLDAAQLLEEKHPEVAVYGIQEAAERVLDKDLYCCTADYTDEVPGLVQLALQKGASALVLPEEAQGMQELAECIPGTVPALYVHDVDEVAARLAVAFYDAPSRDLLLVALSGTHGKTTTSWLIRGILEEVQQVPGMVGSIEWALGIDRLDPDGEIWEASEEDPAAGRECSAPFKVTPYQGRYTLPSTTPNGLGAQKVLAGMKDRGATCCVYEMDPAAVAQGHTQWVEPDVVVHTCLQLPDPQQAAVAPQQQQQLSEELTAAVLEPFEKLTDPATQAVVMNLDDPYVHLVREAASAVPAVTYAIDNKEADVVAETAKFDIWESEVIVRTPFGRLQIITPLLGRHNVYNILAAVATGLALKVPLQSIVAGIEAVESIPGRSDIVDQGQDFSVIVDAADTPEALSAMLTALRPSAKRIITVFGCRGEEESSQRPYMADVAHAHSDMVIITNDSPRTEPPEQIVQDIVAGFPDSLINRYSGYVYFPFQDQGRVPLWFEPYLQKAQRTTQRYVMEDRFSAIRAAIGTAGPGDVVVLAGRGHADFMEYDDGQGGTIRGWFDDKVEASCALSKLSYLNQLRLERKALPWGSALEEMDTLIDPPVPPSERGKGGSGSSKPGRGRPSMASTA